MAGTMILYQHVLYPQHLQSHALLMGYGNLNDGMTGKAGLIYWSEVAAKLATKQFIEAYQELYSQKYSKELPTIETMQEDMRSIFVRVNKFLCGYKDQKTSSELFDLGIL